MEDKERFRRLIEGLNRLLSEVFKTPDTRISTLLRNLNFSETQVETIGQNYLEATIWLILETFRKIIYRHVSGGRIWIILCARYNLTGEEQKRLSELAVRFNISREWVRKLEQKGIHLLAYDKRKNEFLALLKSQLTRWLASGNAPLPPGGIYANLALMPEEPVIDAADKKDKETLSTYPRTLEAWTEEEERFLVAQFKQGKTVAQLGQLFQRGPNTVIRKLRKLGIMFETLESSTVEKTERMELE